MFWTSLVLCYPVAVVNTAGTQWYSKHRCCEEASKTLDSCQSLNARLACDMCLSKCSIQIYRLNFLQQNPQPMWMCLQYVGYGVPLNIDAKWDLCLEAAVQNESNMNKFLASTVHPQAPIYHYAEVRISQQALIEQKIGSVSVKTSCKRTPNWSARARYACASGSNALWERNSK